MFSRPLNGSAELFFDLEAKNHTSESLKEEMISTLDQIENTELEMVRLEDKENYPGGGDIRNRRVMINEYKTKINRMTEDYNAL